MTKPRWQTLRIWPLAGAAVWLALSLSPPLRASSLENLGEAAQSAMAAQPGMTIANPFVANSSPTLEPQPALAEPAAPVLELANVELAPMYRLPAIEEAIDSKPTPSMVESPSAEWQPPAEPAAEPLDEQELLNEMDAVWSEAIEPAPAPTDENQVIHITPPAPPYAPTVAELTRQLLPAVQKAHGLARHGAVYAAQTEFIQVLRRVAQAKDAATGSDFHSQSLAAGLRALDEADDFVPQGKQLEGEMNVDFVAVAHRTPVLHERAATTRPIEAVGLYHQFAREQLARAVAGEQAGSAALYGLGKVHNRLAYDADGELSHERKAMVMFLAALDTVPTNHLAANEIGVLLARGGRPLEASLLFRRAIDAAPTSNGYHNLAVVERKLGYYAQAAANEQYAGQLAGRERGAGNGSRSKGVEWVAPQELSRVAQPMPIEGSNKRLTGPQRMPQPAATGPAQTAAKWPQKLVPGIFRR